ncbi:hypothetical protein DV736_g2982, partial [Chaetothyriales sp. CBS 134916]
MPSATSGSPAAAATTTAAGDERTTSSAATCGRNPDSPAFPPASAFSLLPDVYILLSRLAPLQNAGISNVNGAGASDTLHLTLSHEPALQPADIAAAMYPIRQKVQKAIAAIKALPDIDRTIEEQEAEMRVLEAQIGALSRRTDQTNLGIFEQR